jgi:Putative zinc-finger
MIQQHGSFYGHEFEGHERFRKLCALALSGTLTGAERLDLEQHLKSCDECQEVAREYKLLATVGMPFLAGSFAHPPEDQTWDGSPARHRLRSSIRKGLPRKGENVSTPGNEFSSGGLVVPAGLGSGARAWVIGASAVCLLAVVSLASYVLGRGSRLTAQPPLFSIHRQMQQLTEAKRSSDELLQNQAAQITQAEQRSAKQELEVNRLQAMLRALEKSSLELSAANSESQKQLSAISRELDDLSAQLKQAERSYQSAQAELVSLRAEHDRSVARISAQELKIDSLTASNRDLEQKLSDDNRFLASDRDIRELMGARKLYIADVFDVDSGSRTRKPFGRVFYTQNKSLIFYAFDLDRQPGVRNTSIFQVWGQKDSELKETARATNLGILYMDSESNRRWVLRLDDPKQVAEIDAVFVTVEPHAGGVKPTGKPLLYALLRKEANHP